MCQCHLQRPTKIFAGSAEPYINTYLYPSRLCFNQSWPDVLDSKTAGIHLLLVVVLHTDSTYDMANYIDDKPPELSNDVQDHAERQSCSRQSNSSTWRINGMCGNSSDQIAETEYNQATGVTNHIDEQDVLQTDCGEEHSDDVSETEDEAVCDRCGEVQEQCNNTRCIRGHCLPECYCLVCELCKERVEGCCVCSLCKFCRCKPFYCKCILPSDERIQLDMGGIDLQLLKIHGHAFERSGEADRVVIVRGHTFAVIVVNHPWPLWKADMIKLKERIESAPKNLVKVIRKRTEQVSRDIKAKREWRAHLKMCSEIVMLEPTIADGYLYITSKNSLRAMIEQLASLPTDEPHIAIDLEASDLGHKSPLCTIQIRVSLNNETFIVDLMVLGSSAFDIRSGNHSLRSILEDAKVKKLVFDVRQDSCALYGNMKIKLRGMLDLQIMYMLQHFTETPRFRKGLEKVIRAELKDIMTPEETTNWSNNKNIKITDYNVWQKRPIGLELMAYAAGDVLLLKKLYKKFWQNLDDEGKMWALDWSAVEVERTWCKAKDWVSTCGRTTPGFEKCFARYDLDEWDEDIY